MRSSKEATCNTQSSVKSGSPTRPKSSAPKNETFTCWRSESPYGARRLQVLPLSCSSADCSTNGKAALIASRSSGLSEKKSKSTEARCPSRRATAVPPYRTKPRSAAGRSAGHSRCCAGGNISMRGLKTPLTQTSAQARPERDPRWPGRGGNASKPRSAHCTARLPRVSRPRAARHHRLEQRASEHRRSRPYSSPGQWPAQAWRQPHLAFSTRRTCWQKASRLPDSQESCDPPLNALLRFSTNSLYASAPKHLLKARRLYYLALEKYWKKQFLIWKRGVSSRSMIVLKRRNHCETIRSAECLSSRNSTHRGIEPCV